MDWGCGYAVPSFEYVLLTIIGCGLVTWLSRVLPLVLLKKFQLSPKVTEFLAFVPITIMAALWFENLFTQRLGHLPITNWDNIWASVPTVIAAIITKSLLWIVIIGMASLVIINHL